MSFQPEKIEELKAKLKGAVKQQRIEILIDLAKVYASNNLFDEGIDVLTQATKLTKKYNREDLAWQFLIKISTIYFFKGNYELSLKNCLQCLKLSEKYQNKTGIGSSLILYGAILRVQNEHSKALETYEKALKYFDENIDKTEIAKIYSGIGLVYNELEHPEKALPYFEKVLDMVKENESLLSTAFANLGNTYIILKNFEKAFYFHSKAYELNKHKNNDYNHCITLANLAHDLLEIGKADEALEHLEEALQIAIELKANKLIEKIYEFTFRAYLIKKNYEKTEEYLNLYLQKNKEILNEEKNKKIAEFEVKFQTQKKEQEKEIYRLKNIELVKLNKELKETQSKLVEAEKLKMFYAMVVTANHQLNQPLAAILGNITLIQMTSYQKLDENLKRYLDNLFEASNRCTEILEKLRELKNPKYIDYFGEIKMIDLNSF
ncbi:tetratricopeptide repeat protein [bacterium]|nr:tetratricopeptide repeat protein [bacterium]